MSSFQWFILSFLFLISTLGGSIYTLQSTFYPKVGESKNATALEYTIVFGVYEGTVAITSPIFGSLMPHISGKQLLIAGNIAQGVAVCLFGFLDKFQSLDLFLGFSILLRVLEGVGLSAKFVGMYSLIPLLFPEERTAFVMGILEISIPMGFLIGPLIGSLLYQLGGFLTPFEVIGVSSLILTLGIPPITTGTYKSGLAPIPPSNNQTSVFTLLKAPAVMLNFLVIFVMAAGFGVIFGILEPFLRHTFAASQMTVGAIFAGTGLVYSIFSPLIGLLGGEGMHSAIVFGLVLNLIGGSLVGPLPILPLDVNLTTTCVGLAIFGCGTGIATFSSYLNAIIEAKLAGHPDDDDSGNLSLVTGLFISVFSIGSMVSTPISGFLYDTYSFRTTGYFPAALTLILIICEMIPLDFFPGKGSGVKNVELVSIKKMGEEELM